MLQPAMMLKKLAQKFQLLRSSRQDTARRQQTLTAAIDWSYELLTPWELAAFRQASVFRGGMTAAAADAVLDLSGFAGAPAGSEAVRALVTRSLLEHGEGAGGSRFRMPRTLREYAEAKGNEVDGADLRRELEARHATTTVAYLENWQYRGRSDDEECLQRQQEEMENALAAQTRCLASGDPVSAARAIRSIVELLNLRGPADELAARLEASSAALRPTASEPESNRLLVTLLLARTSAERNFGKWDLAAACSEEAVARARTCGDPALLARALVQHSAGLGFSGQYAPADAGLEEAERLVAGPGPVLELAEVHNARGAILVERGDLVRALESFAIAEPLFRQAGSRHGLLLASSNSAAALINVGAVERALAVCETGEGLARGLGNRAMEAVLLDHRGGILTGMGDLPGAMRAYERACALNRELGRRRGIAINEAHRGDVFQRMGELSRAAEQLALSESIFRTMGDKRAAAGARNALAMTRHRQGDSAGALALLEEPLRYHREQGDPYGLFGILASHVTILSDLGRNEEALQACVEAQAAARSAGATRMVEFFAMVAAHSDIEKGLGHAAEAGRIAREALPEWRRLCAQYQWRGPAVAEVQRVLERNALECSGAGGNAGTAGIVG